jgi:hypothetical protein
MRLTSTGLGIGTSSPGYKLDVRGVAAAGNGTYTTGISWSNKGLIGTFSNHTLGFLTNGAEVMFLDTAGNLGLGVTPSAWETYTALQIKNGSIANYSPTQDMRISSNAYYTSGAWKRIAAAYAVQYLQDGSTGIHAWFNAGTSTADSTISFTQAMTLDASGNLLVGTTSSTLGRLEVVGGAGIRVNEDAAGTKVISIRSAFAGGDPAINVSTNHPLTFLTNNTERARITAAGSVVAGGSVALATTATDGFLYVPTCAGTPTGTPTAITGMAPIVVNTTNNKLYFYSGGAWRDAGP